MSERIYIGCDDKITPADNNLVNLTCRNGEFFENLEPRRLFPVSDLDRYITLIDGDGHEVGLIKSTALLDGESREVIERSLSDYYLVPTVKKIISVSEKYGTLHWRVETDRGERSFDIRNRTHDIKVEKGGKIRIKDSDDNRYIIEDYSALDAQSRKLLSSDV